MLASGSAQVKALLKGKTEVLGLWASVKLLLGLRSGAKIGEKINYQIVLINKLGNV